MSTTPPLTDQQLAEFLAFAGRLADAAGAVIRPYFRSRLAVDDKSAGQRYDPVTEADRGAEDTIRTIVRSTYPEHGIVGEEHGDETGASGYTWVIDPIDGTRAFITGMPLWGTLIALNHSGPPILGVVDQPWLGERYVGSRLGAELRTTSGTVVELRTRSCADLRQAVLYSTHPDLFEGGGERERFDALVARARMTRYGGDCYAYCMLAYGLVDLVVEAGLKPYDVQALIPIVQAAGGVFTNWSGGPAAQGGQVIAAGDPRVHEQARRVLADA